MAKIRKLRVVKKPATGGRLSGARSRFSNWNQNRKAKKAAREPAPAPSYYGRPGRFSGISGGSIGKVIFGIVTLIALVVGIIMMNIWVLIVAFFLIIIIAFVTGHRGAAVFLLIIVILSIFFFMYWSQTATGAYVKTEAGSYSDDLKNTFKSFTSPLNTMKMIFTGEYDPSQLWTSKTYKDKYANTQDVGVKIDDVRPLREEFFEGEYPITIIGRIKAKSLPEDYDENNMPKGVSVFISAKSDAKTRDHKTPVFKTKFDCEPKKITKQSIFIGKFSCTTYGATIQDEQESHDIDVKIKYRMDVKAGKQIFVASQQTLDNLYAADEDPLDYYDISKDAARSWQSEAPIGLGLGISGGEDIIGTYDKTNTVPYYLGISVENSGSGNIMDYSDTIDDLTDGSGYTPLIIQIPKDAITFDETDSEQDFIRLKNANGPILDPVTETYSYILKKSKSFKEVEPGVFKTYIIKFTVSDDYLQEQPYSSFFVLANLDFGYEETETQSVKIIKEPGA